VLVGAPTAFTALLQTNSTASTEHSTEAAADKQPAGQTTDVKTTNDV